MAATGIFLSTSITKLDMLSGGKLVGNGTGFFFKHNSKWYVITNWHVLSGRNPSTGQPRHSSGAVPDQCRFYFTSLTDAGVRWDAVTYLLAHPSSGVATWFHHPVEGQAVDIAALPIEEMHKGKAKDFQDSSGNDPEMLIDLGAELFLPGYPLGLSANGLMAIWKRASLASSLEFGEGINRYFYVDTATREGMSGAPCLAISNWRHCALDRATNKVRVVERPLSWRLLGVYSGRLNPSDSFEAQIGKVWRDNLMLDVLNGRVPAQVELS